MEIMGKRIIGLLLILGLLILGILVNYNMKKISYKEFMTEDTQVVLMNNNPKIDTLKTIKELTEREIDEKSLATLKKVVPQIKRIFLTMTDVDIKKSYIIIEPKILGYYIGKLTKSQYAIEVEDGYYKLKKNYQRGLNYFTLYKGYYLFGSGIKELKSYKREIETGIKNVEIITNLNEEVNFEGFIDLKKSINIPELIWVKSDIVGNRLKQEVTIIEEDGAHLEYEGISKKERRFNKYFRDGRFYLTNNDFGVIVDLLKTIKDRKIERGLRLIQMITGYSLRDILSNIDREIVIDLESSQGIIPLKNVDMIKKLLINDLKDKDGVYKLSTGMTVKFDDNIMYINGIMNKEGSSGVEDAILALSFKLSWLDPNLGDSYTRIIGKIKDDNLVLNFDVDLREIQLLFNEISERMERRHDD